MVTGKYYQFILVSILLGIFAFSSAVSAIEVAIPAVIPSVVPAPVATTSEVTAPAAPIAPTVTEPMSPITAAPVIAPVSSKSSSSAGIFALTLGAGSPGANGGVMLSLSERWTLAVQGNYFKYTFHPTRENVAYNATVNLRSASALLNYHTFGGPFHLTMGGFYNDNSVKGDFAPNADDQICFKGTCYNSSQLGSVSGKITFNPAAPYLGFGWGGNPQESGLGADFNLGAFYQGKPKVNFTATGTSANSAAVQQEINEQTQSIKDKLGKYRVFPVMNFSLYYRF